MNNKQLKKLVKEILDEVAPKGWEGTVKAMKKHKDIDNPWALANWMKNKGYKSRKEEKTPPGLPPEKLKHDACPKCQNKITTLKSTEPILWNCPHCHHEWGNEEINEEHGDVHYWGKQPAGPQSRISTGYRSTPKLNENGGKMDARKKELRKMVIEAAREVVLEYQHNQHHEQQELAQFKMIKDRVDQLMQMHQQGAYDEAKELELVRQIRKISMEIESAHTGTKITANEKANI